MTVLTDADGRRRLEIAPDRVALHRPGAAGLALLRGDGHVLQLSRRGRVLRQAGAPSGLPGLLRVDGFDAGEIRAGCLAAGWDWKPSGTSPPEKGAATTEPITRLKHTHVVRRWSGVKQAKWPYVKRFLTVHLGVIALVAGTVWTALWAASRLGWSDGPWSLDSAAILVLVMLVNAIVLTAVDYRKAARDDTVYVSPEEVVWRVDEVTAVVMREQVRKVVDDGGSLWFGGDDDGWLARMRVPSGQDELAGVLAEQGWPVG